MALSELIIKACLGLMEEDLVEQIKENPCLQFFIDLNAFQSSATFDPSIMVWFRRRLPESEFNNCNEWIVRRRLASKGSPNQGSLMIDTKCPPIDIRQPTDLSLRNDARVSMMHERSPRN